ncbi:MAG: FAD:protein FMN transferase [Gemmatimonadales bacterium]|jgi:thiamine biosynthesis lipoprotein
MTAHLGYIALAAALTVAVADARAQPEGRSADSKTFLQREAVLMGTRLRVQVAAASREQGAAAIEAAFEEVARLESLLSSWRGESEVSRLNRAVPGVPVRVEAEVFELLAQVWEWGRASDGAFDPAVGSLIEVWDLRGGGRRPSAAELEEARQQSGLDSFRFRPSTLSVVRAREGSWITAGGFGKGAALRAARRVLLAAGVRSALLDFGGQLLAVGSPPERDGWRIAVAHPARRFEAAAWLVVEDRSVATSAASERFVEIAGERFGHILDPRSGRPTPAWGSVTVVADDPLVADLASTTLFVLGPEEGPVWAKTLEDIGVLFLWEAEGKIVADWNENMAAWLTESED